jgi:hypothetical protein
MKQNLLTTDQLAEQAQLRPQSLRAAFCRDGHWCGLRPIKLPNRRLLWPADQVNALLSGTKQSEVGAEQ